MPVVSQYLRNAGGLMPRCVINRNEDRLVQRGWIRPRDVAQMHRKCVLQPRRF